MTFLSLFLAMCSALLVKSLVELGVLFGIQYWRSREAKRLMDQLNDQISAMRTAASHSSLQEFFDDESTEVDDNSGNRLQ